jgi:hypothetical protein
MLLRPNFTGQPKSALISASRFSRRVDEGDAEGLDRVLGEPPVGVQDYAYGELNGPAEA